MSGTERLDPRRTTVHGHSLDRDAVAYYEANPGGRYRGDGGEVVAQRHPDGTVHILNGAHRRQAAINQGRKLQARVYGPGERLPSHESGCCSVVIAAAAGLAGLVAAAVEISRAWL